MQVASLGIPSPSSTPEDRLLGHSHFVGLAHLRSLLAHEEVASHPERADAVLDMISVLLSNGSAYAAIKTFCRVRHYCEPVCYLAMFRLRRWLEAQTLVQAGKTRWKRVDLSFHCFRRLLQHQRHQVWEWEATSNESLQDIRVRFDWVTPAKEAHPAATSAS